MAQPYLARHLEKQLVKGIIDTVASVPCDVAIPFVLGNAAANTYLRWISNCPKLQNPESSTNGYPKLLRVNAAITFVMMSKQEAQSLCYSFSQRGAEVVGRRYNKSVSKRDLYKTKRR